MVNEKTHLEKKYKELKVDLDHTAQQIPQDLKNIHDKREILHRYENNLADLQEKVKELKNIEYADYNNEIEYLVSREI